MDETGIGNLALQKLGEDSITTLFPPESSKGARSINKCYHSLRQRLLRRYRFSFAKERASIAALTAAPAFEYLFQYQLPADCLSVRSIGNTRQMIDVDYRTGLERLYSIKGRVIETNLTAPLQVIYTTDVTDVALFDPCFVIMLACEIAFWTCEDITQSADKKESIRKDYREARSEAIIAGAIELPPQPVADDTWVYSRL